MLNLTEKKLTADEQAVSEVFEQVLLVGIVVIMFSVIGAFVFSQEGPADVPHSEVQEIMDISTDTIYLKHTGGEPIIAEDTEVIVNINGGKHVYTGQQIYENLGKKSVWESGDIIEINSSNLWGINIKNDDKVDLFLVDTPSKELIQKSRFMTVYQKGSGLSVWLTPMGKITDTSTSEDGKKGYGDKKQISSEDSTKTGDVQGGGGDVENEDKNCTTYYPTNGTIDSSVYQEYEFSIKPGVHGLRPGDTFSTVTLGIIYYSHDNAIKEIKLKFYDTDELGNGEWKYYGSPLPPNNDEFSLVEIDMTDYITTFEELTNFKIRIEASTTSQSEKALHVDYVGLWIVEDSS